MLKFIPGILLLQVITIALVLIAPEDLTNWAWLRVAVPVFIAGFLTAFWFGAIAAHRRKEEISRLKEYHAQERESIRVNAERAKTKLVKQAQRKTLKEMQRASRRANIKIGLAFAGAAGLGGVLILAQFMSLGLLTLAAVGGALGGYILRIQQEKGKLQLWHKGRDKPVLVTTPSDRTKKLPPETPPEVMDKK